MSQFLEGYGTGDARRERRNRLIAVAVVVAAVAAGVGWYILRDFREKRQADRFVQFVEQKRYDEAYRLWGCDPQKPCRDYSFEKFMADWGKVDLARAKAQDRNCSSGVIRTFEFAGADRASIWIDKSDRVISYSPYDDSCRQPLVQRSRGHSVPPTPAAAAHLSVRGEPHKLPGVRELLVQADPRRQRREELAGQLHSSEAESSRRNWYGARRFSGTGVLKRTRGFLNNAL